MQKTPRIKKPTSPEAIAKMADQGKNIMKFYKGEGRMVQPLRVIRHELGS